MPRSGMARFLLFPDHATRYTNNRSDIRDYDGSLHPGTQDSRLGRPKRLKYAAPRNGPDLAYSVPDTIHPNFGGYAL